MALPLWFVRGTDDTFNPYEIYSGSLPYFTVKFFHGGHFEGFPERRYVNSKINYVDMIGCDEFSVCEVNAMIRELGYSHDEIIYFHYMVPGQNLDYGLQPLVNDNDVQNILEYVENFKIIEMYTEHMVTRLNNYNTNQGPRQQQIEWHTVESEESQGNEVEDNQSEGNEVEYDHATEGSDDSDFIVEDYNEVQAMTVDMDEFRAAVDMEFLEDANSLSESDDGLIDGDDFDSLSESETVFSLKKRVRYVKKHKMKHSTDLVSCPFYVGQSFSNRDEIKTLVKKHAVDSRRQLYIIRNDPKRFRVVCLGIKPVFDGEGTSVKSSKVNRSQDLDKSREAKGPEPGANPTQQPHMSRSFVALPNHLYWPNHLIERTLAMLISRTMGHAANQLAELWDSIGNEPWLLSKGFVGYSQHHSLRITWKSLFLNCRSNPPAQIPWLAQQKPMLC
ncbi:hypothetical protein E3N88_18169 [Mikania micrantha]|uniref:PB1-like domain-containing protein n=1 Tax=Mikania micrantha TaxID=192012 RepID=A0A5N6NVQ0_9ASTR|nr:hypothetical protein E3N88_18169 [Mikania micrantha]